MHQLRRLALALAVSVVAAGGATLMARSAVSSPGAPQAANQPSDEPPNQPPDQQPTGPGPDTGQQPPTGPTGPTYGPTATGTQTGTQTGTGTGTNTRTRTTPPRTTTTPPRTTTTPPRTTTKPPTTRPGGGGGGAGAGANCSNRTVTPVTLAVGTVGGREALVDGSGCAVYVNVQDTQNASACDAACEAQFPPLRAPGRAGNGVAQDTLAQFARTSGVQQVTFFGRQLYYFTGDTAPGQANGQGVNQTWYLVDRAGNPITQ